jgi:maltose alpha-D-glucosyltransferase/alpha-amylase
VLLSLPGSPVLYYGDEIGMGDDVRLPDRDGLRTPMQWSAGVNGGFSNAPAVRPVLPPIDDPVAGFRVVNVSSQEGNTRSLLNAIRRLIRVRRQYRAFGRGDIEIVDCGNPHVLTFVRRFGTETILAAANLSRTSVTISVYGGSPNPVRAVDVLAGGEAVDVRRLTLDPRGFRWFRL